MFSDVFLQMMNEKLYPPEPVRDHTKNTFLFGSRCRVARPSFFWRAGRRGLIIVFNVGIVVIIAWRSSRSASPPRRWRRRRLCNCTGLHFNEHVLEVIGEMLSEDFLESLRDLKACY